MLSGYWFKSQGDIINYSLLAVFPHNMMLHAEKIDDKGETKAHRKMGRKMVPKQMGRFLGNSLTDNG